MCPDCFRSTAWCRLPSTEWYDQNRDLISAWAPEPMPKIRYVPSFLARAQYPEAAANYPEVLPALVPLTSSVAQQWLGGPGFCPWVDHYANALVIVGRGDDADAFLQPDEQTARSTQASLSLCSTRICARQNPWHTR